MAHITLKEVTGKKEAREFLMLPVRLYRNEPDWIRPLDMDIESVFNRKQNKLFRHGDAIRWIAVDESGKTVGRVAAFYDRQSSSANKQPTGGMGFFEAENDAGLAFLLFDKCRDWLRANGMEAMDGPVNFGNRDRWWGLLVDGFSPPNYCMPWNFKWYRNFFEEYGFRNYFEQYTYHKLLNAEGMDPLLMQKALRIESNPDYTFRHTTKSTFDKAPYDFMTVFNKAWALFQGGRSITEAHAKLLFKSMKPVLDNRLLWFGYYKEEPVCFFLMIPEINPIVRRLKGKMNLYGKLKFAYHRYIAKTSERAFGQIFGVVPEQQKKGVEAALITAFARVALVPGFRYNELEFNWIGDFNPSMMHLLDQIGAKIVKTHITYRFMFNTDAPFERASKVNI